MTFKSILSAAAFGTMLFCPFAAKADTEPIDLYSDTWVAIDALDRTMPTAADRPLRTDKKRTVGIFYVSWHYDFFHQQFKSPYAADVTQILQKDPSARLDYNHPLWTHEFAYHWGEPELGYFTSGDRYVIRKDMSMLVDAGVDVLILDVTNAVAYFDAWNALFETMEQMKAEGNIVPKICFWGYNGSVAERLTEVYNYYYAKGKYKDLWFYWDGKPLLLYNEAAKYPQEIYDFFTLRHMWWGYYQTDIGRYVGTEDHWSFGLDMHDSRVANLTPQERTSKHNGRLEQISVTPAQHSSTMVGKSWTVAGGQPNLNEYDMPQKKFVKGKWITHPEAYGFYFRDRWEEALTADPDFIYINDWNEWIAGQFAGDVTFMGRKSNFHFVDQYNAEFNRTIQPMKGGYTDNYYMQMAQNIRLYKGVREAPIASKSCNIDINSPISAWSQVTEEYLDTPGDVTHRDFTGYGGHKYKNTSGRNDILRSKVNVGADKITFFVETASDLTPYTDPNWMLLLINSDCDFKTGWEGFDFLINKEFESSEQTCVMSWDKDASAWKTVGTAQFRTEGRYLVVEVPLTMLGIGATSQGDFYFKWADNPASLTDAISLCTDGDTAPNRRFCYNYRWDFLNSSVGQEIADSELNVELVSGGIHVDCDGDFRVINMLGAIVATGTGDTYLSLPAAGPYIVNCGSRSVKVIVR